MFTGSPSIVSVERETTAYPPPTEGRIPRTSSTSYANMQTDCYGTWFKCTKTTGSGKTGDREAFRRMFEDASKRCFDVVLVWALDRLTREGVFETFEDIRKLTVHGVAFESYTEAHFRTTQPAGELMLAIAAWIAKQERTVSPSEPVPVSNEPDVKANTVGDRGKCGVEI
jgi:hypothetical protein